MNLNLPQGLSKWSTTHFLVALVLLFVAMPFLDRTPRGEMIEAALGTVVLLAAVSAVGGRRRTLIIALALLAPTIFGRWVDHFQPGLLPAIFTPLVSIVFVAFIVIHLLHYVLVAPRVDEAVVCAGIANFLLLGVLWSFAYTILARVDSDAFKFTSPVEARQGLNGFLALYYSISALTTSAVGDIVPVSNPARMLTLLEGMAGMFYMAVILARLVALYSTELPEPPADSR